MNTSNDRTNNDEIIDNPALVAKKTGELEENRPTKNPITTKPHPKLTPMDGVYVSNPYQTEQAKNNQPFLPPIHPNDEESSMKNGQRIALNSPQNPYSDFDNTTQTRGDYTTGICCCKKEKVSASDFLYSYYKNQLLLVFFLLLLAAADFIISFPEEERDRRKGPSMVLRLISAILFIFLVIWFIDALVFFCKVKKSGDNLGKIIPNKEKILNKIGNILFLILNFVIIVLSLVITISIIAKLSDEDDKNGDKDDDDDHDNDDDDDRLRRILESPPPPPPSSSGDMPPRRSKKQRKEDNYMLRAAFVIIILRILLFIALVFRMKLKKSLIKATNEINSASQGQQITPLDVENGGKMDIDGGIDDDEEYR